MSYTGERSELARAGHLHATACGQEKGECKRVEPEHRISNAIAFILLPTR